MKEKPQAKRKVDAEAKKRSGSYDKAVAEFEKGIKLVHKHALPEARDHFKAAIDGYPEELEVCERSRIYLAIIESQQSPKKPRPKTPEDFYFLGVLEHNAGAYADAIQAFEKAMEGTPDDGRLHYAIAASHCKAGQEKEALGVLRKAVGKSSQNALRAIRDDDFEALDAHPEFLELTERPDPEARQG